MQGYTKNFFDWLIKMCIQALDFLITIHGTLCMTKKLKQLTIQTIFFLPTKP